MYKYISKVFVINLDKDTERLKKISKDLEKYDINFIRFPAIVGNDIKSDNKITPFCNSMCTSGIKGCGLSHLKIWKMIIDQNLQNALILEDDSEFCNNFYEKFENFMQRVPSDYDILQLGCVTGCNRYDDNGIPIYITEKLISKDPTPENGYNKLHYMSGAHAYIITNKAAQELYNNITLSTHIDLEISIYMDNHSDFNIYSPTTDLITQKALNFCSNLTDKFPNLLLKVLDKIHFYNHKSVSLGWMLTESFFHIPLFDINAFFIIFIIVSIISKNHEKLKYTILIWLLLEIIYSRGNGFQYLILFLILSKKYNF